MVFNVPHLRDVVIKCETWTLLYKGKFFPCILEWIVSKKTTELKKKKNSRKKQHTRAIASGTRKRQDDNKMKDKSCDRNNK